MTTLAKRVGGATLALLGLVLAAVGLWYAVHLGGSGTATFTATATGTTPVVVPQTVLNRVDDPVEVTVTPESGGAVWLAAASPSDAKAVLGGTARTTVTGVSTRPWQLERETNGTGAAPALANTDVWRNTETGDGAVSMTIDQANAPETVIAQATEGQLADIELTWERKSWFVQSVITALVGLFLLLSGVSLLWSSRRGSVRALRANPPVDAAEGTLAYAPAEAPAPAAQHPTRPVTRKEDVR